MHGMMTKEEARTEARRILKATLPEERVAWSAAIRAALRGLPAFRAAQTVVLFACLPSEPDLLPLLSDPACGGKRFLFPRVDAEDRMTLHAVRRAADLVTGHYRFREPAADSETAALKDVDLIVVPGLAFTAAGVRLGRGKGHYDRMLSREEHRAVLAGVCFRAQIAETLPSEAHDVRMDLVLCEDS